MDVDNIFGYAGYIFNPETGTYLARHRWYDPELGRWLSRDPAGYADGMLLYVYVNGNPMVLVDPLGLFSWLPWDCGGDEANAMAEEQRDLLTAKIEERFAAGDIDAEERIRLIRGLNINLTESLSIGTEQIQNNANIKTLETTRDVAVVAGSAPVGGWLFGAGAKLFSMARHAVTAAKTAKTVTTMAAAGDDVGRATVAAVSQADDAARAANAAKMAKVRQAGEVGQQAAEDIATARGHQILGRQVTMEAPNGVRVRVDFVSQSSSGELFFHEAKNGLMAGLTSNQRAAYPLFNQPGWIPRGANAAGAGLEVGERLPGINLVYSRFLLP